MNKAVRFSQVFVLGVPRSGSTLLGKMLNMHPRVLCVGEMARVELAIRKHRPCSCGEPLQTCAFWSSRLPILASAHHYNYMRFTPEIFDRIRATTTQDVIVDLSKTRTCRMMRSWRGPLKKSRAGFILLLRDTRGIMASSLRRNSALRRHLRTHKKWFKRLAHVLKSRQDCTQIMRYEDLCRDPQAALHRVSDFIGLGFHDDMLRPSDGVHHFIHSSETAYLRSSNEIHLDERWRDELDQTQRMRIEAVMRALPFIREHYLEAAPQSLA